MTRDQVQELLDSATPGPWRFSNSSDTTGMKGEFRAPNPMNGFMLVRAYVNEGDPALIAAAPDVFRWSLERDQAATEWRDNAMAENAILIERTAQRDLAEAKLAAVEAMADQWATEEAQDQDSQWIPSIVIAELRAALAGNQEQPTPDGGPWDIGSPEPQNVTHVHDDSDDEDDGNSSHWGKTADGSWKGYKAGYKTYLDWPALVRRWGPVTATEKCP